MSKEKLIWAAVGVVLGIVFAQQIRKLPGVSAIPEI
jgi:hypothetical protein